MEKNIFSKKQQKLKNQKPCFGKTTKNHKPSGSWVVTKKNDFSQTCKKPSFWKNHKKPQVIGVMGVGVMGDHGGSSKKSFLGK